MKYFSVFTGVGGFELGIQQAWKEQHKKDCRIGNDYCSAHQPPICGGFSEIDKYASAVLRYRFPNVKNYGDITKIEWANVPDFDLLVGGSPCQDMSVAGKRAGIHGGRSGLFVHYIEALKVKQPRHFIWENVKGCLSSNGGRDFAFILNQMAEAGYSLWWQVLNTKDFGVPQNRERVFVVGTRNGSPREVFFERGDAGKSAGTVQGQPDEPRSPSLTSSTGGRHQPMISYSPKARADSTIDDQHPQTVIPVGLRIRRLTPIECERLMSWPDDWTRYGADETGVGINELSDTQRYKMCGNGVVSKVVTELLKAHFL